MRILIIFQSKRPHSIRERGPAGECGIWAGRPGAARLGGHCLPRGAEASARAAAHGTHRH